MKPARDNTPIRVRVLAMVAKILGLMFKIDGIPYGALPKEVAPYYGIGCKSKHR